MHRLHVKTERHSFIFFLRKGGFTKLCNWCIWNSSHIKMKGSLLSLTLVCLHRHNCCYWLLSHFLKCFSVYILCRYKCGPILCKKIHRNGNTLHMLFSVLPFSLNEIPFIEFRRDWLSLGITAMLLICIFFLELSQLF